MIIVNRSYIFGTITFKFGDFFRNFVADIMIPFLLLSRIPCCHGNHKTNSMFVRFSNKFRFSVSNLQKRAWKWSQVMVLVSFAIILDNLFCFSMF